jgi:hypothetical protein
VALTDVGNPTRGVDYCEQFGEITVAAVVRPDEGHRGCSSCPSLGHVSAPYTEARIWFGMTGGDAGSAAPAGTVTIRCVQTGQDFLFDLSDNSIARPTSPS